MQITKTDIDSLNAKLTLVVEPQDYEEGVEKEIRTIRQRANIPGFRPGKVPASLIKKQYGKAVLAEEINKVISEKLYDYIREQKLNILGEPLSNEAETPELDFDNQTSFTFVFDIAVAPAFNAKLTASQKLPYYDIEVTDEMVDSQVKMYASRYGSYEQPEVAEENDMLRGDLLEQAENGKKIDAQVLTPAYMTPAQKKHFVGAKIGDIITFNPKKAYKNEAELASLLKITAEEVKNMKSDFTFTVIGITRHKDAEINQDLFDKVFGAGSVKSEEEFRGRLREQMAQNFNEEADYKFGEDIRTAVLKKMDKVALPEEFLKRWLKTSNKELTDEQIEADWSKTMESLRWQLAKDQLAEQFEVDVKPEEVNDYAKKLARMQFLQYGMMNVEDEYLESFAKDMLKDENQVRNFYERVREEKIFAGAKEIVKLDKKTISHDEFNKLFK